MKKKVITDTLILPSQFPKLKFHIKSENVMYVYVDNWTIYIDNSHDDKIVTHWIEDHWSDEEEDDEDIID